MDVRKINIIILSIAVISTVVGGGAAFLLPNSLLPNISTPQIDLNVNWAGRSASEIEQVLVAPLERQLSDVEDLILMESSVRSGSATTTVKFHPEADMDKAYMQVLARVNQIPGWPANVLAPTVLNRGAGGNRILATVFLHSLTENKSEHELISTYKKVVEPVLRSVPGVSSLNTSQNTADERIDIEFDPKKLAQLSLPIEHLRSTLNSMVDRSGDVIELGSREFELHFKGQLTLAQLSSMPISVRNGQVFHLNQIAELHTRVAEDWNYSEINGKRAFYIQIKPNETINALKTIEDVKKVMSSLNGGVLLQNGMSLTLSRDDSIAINDAIHNLYISVFAGLLLSCLFLYFYLKNWRTLLIVFICTVVCLSIVICLMKLNGFSVNVISLAGIAISVGLVMEAAIISIDSILHLQSKGMPLKEAIPVGVSKVRGALISSTFSSLIIFLPILAMNSAEGQLFKDLAFTTSGSLVAALFAGVFLVPALSHFLLKDKVDPNLIAKDRHIAQIYTTPVTNKKIRHTTLVIGFPLAVLLSLMILPPVDTLPSPKQRLVFANVNFSEVLSINAVRSSIADVVNSRIESEGQRTVKFRTYGMMCTKRNCLIFFYPDPDWRYEDFKKWVGEKIVINLSDTQTSIFQGELLTLSLPDNRLTKLDIGGAPIEQLQEAGRKLMGTFQQEFKGANIFSATPLVNRSSRIQFTPKYEELLYYGLSIPKLNEDLVALTNGSYLGHFSTGSDLLPYYLKGKTPSSPEELLGTEIIVAGHGLVPIRELVKIEYMLAPDSSLRVNNENVVSINLNAPENLAVGEFVQRVKAEVDRLLPQLNDGNLYVRYRGGADNLSLFLTEFSRILFVSLLLLGLLAWYSLNSWRSALLVLLSLPLYFVGAVLMLQFLNVFYPQSLDVITMIGFVILMGLAVNNAILIIAEYDFGVRNLNQREAIFAAVRTRKGAIYMSTGTTILGMVPMILNPDDGAEMYRGLAAVIIGGSLCSVLSMSFVSAALSLRMFAKVENEVPVDSVMAQ